MLNQLSNDLERRGILSQLRALHAMHGILRRIALVLHRFDEVILNRLHEPQLCRVEGAVTMDNLVHHA